MDYCSIGNYVTDWECGNNGGQWIIADDPTNHVYVDTDVSQIPTLGDIWDFWNLWTSGNGPSEINYSANDGWTVALESSDTFGKIRSDYAARGCPGNYGPQGSGHFKSYEEGFGAWLWLGGNPSLMEVGGFSAYAKTNGKATTFTIVNNASNSSFWGETTWAPMVNKAIDASGNWMPELQQLQMFDINPNGLDNPAGPTEPRHNIRQVFTFTENNVCNSGG